MGLLEFLIDYQYNRAPEGTDPLGKLIGICKYGVLCGFTISAVDSCLLEPARPTIGAVANNVAYWTLPLTGMCAAFASTAYIAADLRKTDDSWNYVLGSMAAGGVFQAWTKNARLSYFVTIMTMIYAVSKKEFQLNGISIIDANVRRDHGVWWDYTYLKDPRSTGWQPRARGWL